MRPRPPEDAPESPVIYHTDLIRQVAGKIIAGVGIYQPTHESTWNTIQTYLDGDNSSSFTTYDINGNVTPHNGEVTTAGGSMPDVYFYLKNVLEPHAKRLSASFDLQLQFAEALFTLADQIDEVEQRIKDGFKPDPTPPPPPTHGATAGV